MASFIRAQVNIPNDVAVPVNVAMNTWHFNGAAIDPTDDIALIHTALAGFYGTIDGGMSGGIASPATVKYYLLTDPIPRAPLEEDTITLSPSAGARFPNEVAICLSYHALPGSGLNQRRRRGRIFLGPWSNGVGESGDGDARITSAERSLIVGAAETMADALIADTIFWCVFSPSSAGAEPWDATALDAAFFPVSGGYVDDAFDTIRSRGLAPTARTSFDVTLP